MNTFQNAIRGKEKISVIAEIKRYSPSYGKPFPSRNMAKLISAYEQGGAAALSVVTAENLFQGSMKLLEEARRLTHLPIIRKDFITGIADLDESVDAGADAVLLITHYVTRDTLKKLVQQAMARGLDPVVEIHFEEDLKKIEGLTNIIVGINNRNLETFKTDVHYAEKLLPRLDPKLTIIVESAFRDAADFIPYQGKIDAVLVGTALLETPDPCQKLLSLTS